MSVAAYTNKNTASVTREHNFLGANRGNMCVEQFRLNSAPPVREKTRVDTRDQRRETTKDCKGHE